MTIATDMLNLYIEAEKAVLSGKEYMMNGRRLMREDLGEIRKGRQEWQRVVNSEQAKRTGGSASFSLAEFK